MRTHLTKRVLSFGLLMSGALWLSACSQATFSKEEDKSYICEGAGCSESALTRFGMVSDRTDCVFCHLTIQGDIGATAAKPFALHPHSQGKISGNVFSQQEIKRVGGVEDPDHVLVASDAGDPQVFLSGGNFKIHENVDDIEFPAFKADKLKAGATGSITENGAAKVNKTHIGNLVIDGRGKTIAISGEVFVEGDVVIYGDKISGSGTLYASGNIYIPDDINLGNEVRDTFNSFRSNLDSADTTAKNAIASRASSLRLAAGEYIIIGDPGDSHTRRNLPAGTQLKNYFDRDYKSIYTGENLVGQINSPTDGLVTMTRTKAVDDFLTAEAIYAFADRNTRIRVFKWDPNYMERLKPEYELTAPAGQSLEICGSGKKFRVGIGMVARIDAALYAAKGIGGLIGGGGSFVINGGVITRSLNLLGGTTSNLSNDAERTWRFRKNVYEMEKDCSTVGRSGYWKLPKSAVNPFNGMNLETNTITYDYRLRNGGAGFDIMRSAGY